MQFKQSTLIMACLSTSCTAHDKLNSCKKDNECPVPYCQTGMFCPQQACLTTDKKPVTGEEEGTCQYRDVCGQPENQCINVDNSAQCDRLKTDGCKDIKISGDCAGDGKTGSVNFECNDPVNPSMAPVKCTMKNKIAPANQYA